MDKNIWRLKVPGRAWINVSMYPLMETQLKQDIIERRERKARVSSLWIKQHARKIVAQKYPNNSFKGANGWFLRFMRRHNIKF